MSFMEFMGEELLVLSPIDVALQEMHNLAYFYHWSRSECWDMPCTERGMWNDKIKAQIKAENKGGNKGGNTPKSSYKESR